MKKLIFITVALLSLSPIFAAAADDNASGVDRYAVYIGSNKGGKGREELLYAGSDAQNFKKAMSEIGGVTEDNSYVLIDPSKETIDQTLNNISRKINNSQSHAKRSEFIFYYSGHSDENALLLGDIPYDYSSLKAAITEVPSDIHVVILDSCYSGNFIRTKGGQKRKPFLIDDSSVVTGHAYLSSSSTNEYSQESDEIESSYFTNAMITGLRGAADASGDNKVTLNELYSYAFNDTLSKTESSKAGPQHPNYNITLVGSGDLVLSDISTAESMLSLSKEAKGKFIIRDANGKLISEINKVAGQPIFMALPAAQYSAVIIDEYSTKQGYFVLEKDQVYVLDQNSLSTIKRKTNRVRGGEVIDDDEILPIDDLEENSRRGSRRRYDTDNMDELPEPEDDDEPKIIKVETIMDKPFDPNSMNVFHLSAVPGVTLAGFESESSLFSVGIIGALDKNIYAIQHSNVMNIVSNNLNGLQLSGVFNIAGQVRGAQVTGVFNTSGDVSGAQVAGVFNTAKDVNGIQTAGLFNVAQKVNGVQAAGLFNSAKEVKGVQLGVINIADSNDGLAIGVINIIKDGMHHLGFNWDTNGMFDMFFQSGTKNLFITIGVATDAKEFFSDKDWDDSTRVYYGGFGTEFRFGFSSLDLEFLGKFVYNRNELPQTGSEAYEYNFGQLFIPSFRLTFNPFSLKHIDFSLGASFDIHNWGANDTAFAYTYHRFGDDEDDTTVHPAVFIGFKIK
ncbi:caspase family protein [Treponema bryantii]|uniref:caspase family protein n=1 Tax=Treponema bryantii TaxID=163 RepID=UPI0003B48E9C|nr:caspase family protein [Treponema bryantii]